MYLKRAVKEHLPEGDHTEPTPQMMAKTKSVPILKHNKFSESIFGILHHLSVVRPNASILANEAFALFSLNKTLDWLENKSSDERNRILTEGRRLTKEIRFKFHARTNQIKRERETCTSSTGTGKGGKRKGREK